MARSGHILHLRGLLYPAVPPCTLPLYVSVTKVTHPTYPSEHGLATHYIPSTRVSMLLESFAALEKPTYAQINEAIEDLHYDREPADPVAPLSGAIRVALDSAFSRDTVEGIVTALQNIATGNAGDDVVQWAKDTLAILEERSPTSLKIALLAIRKGGSLGLLETFNMELGIADAFCVGFSCRVTLQGQLNIS
jgi:3-hydroxyisobutyryl-CoA hydrolase